MKKFFLATFSTCLIALLCVFTLTGCNSVKTVNISEEEYNQIISSSDKFFTNYSFASFSDSGEKIIEARCVKEGDALKMKMKIASRPDTAIYFFDNVIYVDENGEKDCFEYDPNMQPDFDNPSDFARKVTYMQYVTQAVMFGQEIETSQDGVDIEQTKEYNKIEKETNGKEITLRTSGTQNVKQTAGVSTVLTTIKFEIEDVYLGHARVKYSSIAENNTLVITGENVNTINLKQKILVESATGDVALPNLEEFAIKE